MRTRGSLAALVLALGVVGEWVPVPVIDRGSEPRRPQGPPAPTTFPSPQPVPEDPIGPPGPPDDVITIRRTVGDSFSNKKGTVVQPAPAQDRDVGGAGAVTGTQQQQQREEDDGVYLEDELEVREDADEPQGPQGPQGSPGPDPEAASGSGLPLEELREAHRALLKQSTAPVSGKLDFLRRLKNRLLRHIAALVPQTALSLAGGGVASAAAGGAAQAEGRGHKGLGFPSNEGTLMSLAFLVFAVFLVKVVLQLIYAVQNSQANNAAAAGVRVAQMQIPSPMMPAAMGGMMGTMMNMVPAMMPPMMAAMDPAMAMAGRARRDADGDGLHRITANVMEAIDRARDKLATMGEG